MIKELMRRLDAGDLVALKGAVGALYLVSEKYKDHVTVVRTTEITDTELGDHEWFTGGTRAEEIARLNPSDQLRNSVSGEIYIITGIYRAHATGVDTREITAQNLEDWEVVACRREIVA